MSKKSSMSALLALTLGAALALAGGAASAAEQCRDANGRFMKCPEQAQPRHCRDVTSKKFVKCGSPHSEPVPAASGR